jgi:hypothetical protein
VENVVNIKAEINGMETKNKCKESMKQEVGYLKR